MTTQKLAHRHGARALTEERRSTEAGAVCTPRQRSVTEGRRVVGQSSGRLFCNEHFGLSY